MLQCWNANQNDRPDFTHIRHALEEMIQNSNINILNYLIPDSRIQAVNSEYINSRNFPGYESVVDLGDGYEIPIRLSKGACPSPYPPAAKSLEYIPKDSESISSYPLNLSQGTGESLESLPPVFLEENEDTEVEGPRTASVSELRLRISEKLECICKAENQGPRDSSLSSLGYGTSSENRSSSESSAAYDRNSMDFEVDGTYNIANSQHSNILLPATPNTLPCSTKLKLSSVLV